MKFDNAKEQEIVWSSIYGEGKIIEIRNNKDNYLPNYPLTVVFNNYIDRHYYTLDGKEDIADKYPSLFWNKIHIPTDKEDIKPFDLLEFLKTHSKPKKFEYTKENYYIYYDYVAKSLYYGHNCSQEMDTVYFNNSMASVCNELIKHGITWKQLKQAYRDLCWI